MLVLKHLTFFLPLCHPQAVLAQGGAGQPTQTQDLEPVQRGFCCHHVLLRF